MFRCTRAVKFRWIHCNKVFIFSYKLSIGDGSHHMISHGVNIVAVGSVRLCANAYFCISDRFCLLRNIFKLENNTAVRFEGETSNINVFAARPPRFVSIFHSCESRVIHCAEIRDGLREFLSGIGRKLTNAPIGCAR
jgi:hypothetical protein